MTRYSPSRIYRPAGLAALFLAGVCGWFAMGWSGAWLAAVLFLLTGTLLLALGLQPPIEIRESHLQVGRRAILWEEIREVNRTGWVSPLVLHLRLEDQKRLLVIYPGDLDSANSLLRHVRRLSKEALIDGIPYREFWGEAPPPPPERKALPSPRYQVVRPEDEAEIERMFQRLKAEGRLEPRNMPEEK